MTRHQLISELASRGVDVRRHHIEHAIRSGIMTVPLDRGWRAFTPAHVEQMRNYRSDVRSGRSRKPTN